jgi:hypothetical protein
MAIDLPDMRLVFIVLLCGCATSTQSVTAAGRPESDCSFRSPTTCWTISARFPPRRAERTVPPVQRKPTDPAPVLANGADSARSIP